LFHDDDDDDTAAAFPSPHLPLIAKPNPLPPPKKNSEEAGNGKPAEAAAASNDDADDEDVMASIIQKQKELEEAKARAAQKLNQVRGCMSVHTCVCGRCVVVEVVVPAPAAGLSFFPSVCLVFFQAALGWRVWCVELGGEKR
jgi:hypothetical protein